MASGVFLSDRAATSTISATTSSARAALPSIGGAGTVAAGSPNVRLYNAGSTAVFVSFGNSTVTASAAADMPLAPGSVEVFDRGDATHIAAITGSGTATVYITTGSGF